MGWQREFAFLSIIFRENKWLQNQNQNLPFDLVHNWKNYWEIYLIISPTNNIIVFHNHNQIAFGGKNNKQNQILQLLIYHLRRLNNNLFIFHGSIQILSRGNILLCPRCGPILMGYSGLWWFCWLQCSHIRSKIFPHSRVWILGRRTSSFHQLTLKNG